MNKAPHRQLVRWFRLIRTLAIAVIVLLVAVSLTDHGTSHSRPTHHRQRTPNAPKNSLAHAGTF